MAAVIRTTSIGKSDQHDNSAEIFVQQLLTLTFQLKSGQLISNNSAISDRKR